MELRCFGSNGCPSRRLSRTGSTSTCAWTTSRRLRRVIDLGGVRVEQGDFREYDVVFRVMLDPEGNEFCLVCDAVRDSSGGDR
jgi:hypothetical protein